MTKNELLAKYNITNGSTVKALLVAGLCVLCGLLLLQTVSFAIYGPADGHWPLSLMSTLGLIPINTVMLVLRKRWKGTCITVYSWVVLIAVTILLLLYPWTSYPQIVAILPLLSILCAYVNGLGKTMPLLIACSIVLAGVAIFFGFGNTVPIMIFCVVASVAVGKLRDRFTSLELAIRIVANG